MSGNLIPNPSQGEEDGEVEKCQFLSQGAVVSEVSEFSLKVYLFYSI